MSSGSTPVDMVTLRQESVAITIDISRVTTLYQSPPTMATFSSGQSEQWRGHDTTDMRKPQSACQGRCLIWDRLHQKIATSPTKPHTISGQWCRHQDQSTVGRQHLELKQTQRGQTTKHQRARSNLNALRWHGFSCTYELITRGCEQGGESCSEMRVV